ncbi:hypothetical protein L3X38_030562 [Prunus dulcis]|uniref:Uncharacterized protein n=1 Tax=Prunus dulcis TaxID=3755 RepID=A0AAD4VBP5_PRUDU|nr:hypothetical protein L3X38_030562 [Prunus dulcis]
MVSKRFEEVLDVDDFHKYLRLVKVEIVDVASPKRCEMSRNLAMVELKVLIALIVSNFSFSLSPNYNHGPALRLVVEPEH